MLRAALLTVIPGYARNHYDKSHLRRSAALHTPGLLRTRPLWAGPSRLEILLSRGAATVSWTTAEPGHRGGRRKSPGWAQIRGWPAKCACPPSYIKRDCGRV